MNILNSLRERCFLTPRADFVSESQMELVKLIMKRHGEDSMMKIKLIDENDDYDSFLVELDGLKICLKMSFDSVPIFYEYMVLKGISELQLSPQAIDRNEIFYGKKIFYTLQTYEFSNNLAEIGVSNILDESFADFNFKLTKMHTYLPPDEVHEYLDDTRSYLEYHDVNFEKIISYVDSSKEQEIYSFIKQIYSETYQEMMFFFEKNKNKLQSKKFVHGNLGPSTIINNDLNFKIINFENCFLGSPLFDIANLVFELQMNGLKEHDFVCKKMESIKLIDNSLQAGKLIEEYKICKYIWIRKKLLDMIREYIKEVIILNNTRTNKMSKLANNFSKNFYKFCEINAFNKNKDSFIQRYNDLILNN